MRRPNRWTHGFFRPAGPVMMGGCSQLARRKESDGKSGRALQTSSKHRRSVRGTRKHRWTATNLAGGDEDAEREDMPQAESPQGPAPPLPPPPCSPSAEPQIDFEVGLDAARAAERCRALAARVLRLTDQTGSRSSGRALARSVMLRCGLTSWVNLARDWQ